MLPMTFKGQQRKREGKWSMVDLLENQTALQMQMDYEDDSEYFIPSKRAKHKPSKKSENSEEKRFPSRNLVKSLVWHRRHNCTKHSCN